MNTMPNPERTIVVQFASAAREAVFAEVVELLGCEVEDGSLIVLFS
jgi:hypothetical protein